VAIYESAGWRYRNRMVSPADLADVLRLKLQVRAINPPKPPQGGFFMSEAR
jgi:hypothetical protein